MTATAIDTTERIIELSDAAYQAFCEGISGMFGVDMRCDRKQTGTGAAGQLQTHFKKLAAVHPVNADGVLTGTFHLLFDQAGLFILSGVVVMLPESRILEQVKRGSMENTDSLQDAAKEVGNLLVGSWDTSFRDACPGHKHFVKKTSFIGKLWDKGGQMELSADEQVLLILYEMTVEPYPSFMCAAVFPQNVLSGIDCAGTEQATRAPNPPEPASKPQAGAGASQAPATSDNDATEGRGDAPSPGVGTPHPTSAGPAQRAAPAATVQQSACPAGGESAPVRDSAGSANAPAPDAAPAAREVSREPDTVPSYVAPVQHSCRPDHGLAELLQTPAAKIMERDVVWASSDDTVQAVLAKMQQHNTGYVLIGQNGAIEGLVSNSNILGAVSLYLRPVFAKWRRQEDDATLGVKVKWIMSRPVRTIRPDATLEAMIESLRRCGGRCLPVVDEKGTVQGIVTTFNILLYLVQADGGLSWKGKPPQAPALLL